MTKRSLFLTFLLFTTFLVSIGVQQGFVVAVNLRERPGFQGRPPPADHGFFFYGLGDLLPPLLRRTLGRPALLPSGSHQHLVSKPLERHSVAAASRGEQPRPPLAELDWEGGEGACYDAAADGLTNSAGAASSASGGASGSPVAAEPSSRPPVIYLPPLTGTVLEGRLDDKPSVPHWWCPRRSAGWFTLWLTLDSLLPWQFPCFADNIRLVPGGSGQSATPPPGVQVRLGATLEPPHGGGGGGGGLSFQPWGSVAARLRQLGWRDDLLDSHAYDWRQSPPEWSRPGGSFHQLRAAVEAKVAASGRRAVLLGLSLGASYGASFLASGVVDEGWKARHVERLVAMSGVWEGTPRSPWDVLSGRLEGLEAVLPRGPVRQLMRGIPALTWTFPAPPAAAAAGEAAAEPVVSNSGRGRNYTAAQLGEALRDAGAPEAAAFWQAALPFTRVAAPNVTTHCFYSYGLDTAVHVSYSRPDFSDPRPQVRYGNGDVTVPYRSLAACRLWAAHQSAPVFSASYYGVVHGTLTGVPEALQDIVEAVAGPL